MDVEEVGMWLGVRWLDPNPEALALGYLTYHSGADWREHAWLWELANTLVRCSR